MKIRDITRRVTGLFEKIPPRTPRLRTWAPLFMLLLVAGPLASIQVACCLPRWAYNHPGTQIGYFCGGWLDLPHDGVNEIPFLPQRLQASSHYHRNLALVDPGSDAKIYPSSAYISPDQLKDKRLYCVDMSWQYVGNMFLAPMLLQRVVAAEFFLLRKSNALPPHGAVPPPLEHPADLPLIGKAFDEFWTLRPDVAPPANVRRELTRRLSPEVKSLGREIYWPGVLLNVLFVLPLLLTLYVFINFVRAAVRWSYERSRAGRIARGLCPRCRYETAGLAADELGFLVCPECGERIEGKKEPIRASHPR